MEKFFRLKERGTTAKTEVVAGLTTFMTMAYILAVNPNILSQAGMNSNAVLIATCLASCVGCLLMGLLANLPFALSAGMGLNAYLTYTVVMGMGIPWQTALLAVFIEGLIFIILSVTNVREAIFNAIPMSLKKGVSVGIGLFIAFIGLQDAGLCQDASTLVTIVDFNQDFHTVGISALLAFIGVVVTAILYIRKIPGSILFGILITWILGMVSQLVGLYVPDPENSAYSLFPSGVVSFDYSELGQTFGQCFSFDLGKAGILDLVVVVFAFLFVDLFDTLGTLIGVSTKANMLDAEGRLPGIKPALLSDAIATSCGAVMGTSTVTTFVESSAGVAAGGRTGLTAIVTGGLFLLSSVFSPIFSAIPSFATAPALIMVGFLMFEGVKDLAFEEDFLTDAVPAYLCIIAMPLFYSISEGISIGCISYVILNLACGKKEKLNPLLIVIAILFVCKYIFL